LEFHKETLFKGELVPHLVNVFFFRPVFTAYHISYGKYRIYMRHAVDKTCNLLEKCTLSIYVKESKDADDQYQLVHQLPFMSQELFDELMQHSPSFVDCHLVDFNFEEEDDEQELSIASLDKLEVKSCAAEKQKPLLSDKGGAQSSVLKTIDVKFELLSQSYEWKQGWWIDAFVFEPVLDFEKP